MNKTITIDGIDYVRADLVPNPPEGDYHLVVLDRGWIFHGRLVKDGGTGAITLYDAVNVRSWKQGGFGGLTKSAKASGATLDPCADVVFKDPIFVVPTGESWRHE